MLEAYRDELVRCGLTEQAMLLKGLEIFTISEAQVALATIRSLPDNRDLKRYVIASIEQAIGTVVPESKAS